MKIEDLKTGMLILDGKDNLKMVVGNTAIGVAPSGGTTLTRYTFEQCKSSRSIQKIFTEPKAKKAFNADMEFWLGKKKFLESAYSNVEVIWEAKEELYEIDNYKSLQN